VDALAHVGWRGIETARWATSLEDNSSGSSSPERWAQQPHVLLLDEPTTGLDITTQHNVVELVQHLHEELGLTVLLITHDINMIRSRVDRLVLLKTRLYAAGPPADVLKPDILSQVYGKDLVITEKDLVIVEDYTITIIDHSLRCLNYSRTISCNVHFWLRRWLVPCARRSVSSSYYEGWRLWEPARRMRRLPESRSAF